MRKMRFRAWDSINKAWINVFKIILSADGDIMAVEAMDGEMYGLHQAVLGISTGLRDNHGKEIYEGDVVSDDPAWVVHPGRKVVEWDKENAGWNLDPFSEDEYVGVVVGNLYENPEMVGERKESYGRSKGLL